MKRVILYLHGKGGSAAEAERYRALCPGYDVVGLDYRGTTPWDTAEELRSVCADLRSRYDSVILLANSIGAYFAMNAGAAVDRAFLISPIVDMERLIRDMMTWAHVTEEELRARGSIETDFGETLSWEYLRYVRAHPIRWTVPTAVLYGGRDHLTSLETVSRFAEQTGAVLTVMEQGEHWFHTPEQLAVLDRWLTDALEQDENGPFTPQKQGIFAEF